MAIRLVNLGQIENDGTGDDLREAFVKVNENFSDLSLTVADIVNKLTLSGNIGTKVISGYDTLSVVGETSIRTELVGNVLTIKNNFNRVLDDNLPTLSNNLNANNRSINNLTNINGVDLADLYKVTGSSFDFGEIAATAKNIIDWIILNNNVNMGSFTQPTNISINLGSF